MINETELVTRINRLEVSTLHHWVELGLVTPRISESGYVFEDLDVARVSLVCELCFDLGVEEDTLPVVMSLLDQLHTTRRHLRHLTAAIANQPKDVREAIGLHVKVATAGLGNR